MKKGKQDNENLAKALQIVEEALYELSTYHKDWQSLFVWHDGPLVQAMRDGDMFLVDEISLADDSVLERLNSVLEPKRLLVIMNLLWILRIVCLLLWFSLLILIFNPTYTITY